MKVVLVYMESPTYIVNHIPEYTTLITHYPKSLWYYRGQANGSWPLIPKAGRDQFYMDESNWDHPVPRDLGRFIAWRELAIAYHQQLPQNQFDCLAFAQHYGLATRLLD